MSGKLAKDRANEEDNRDALASAVADAEHFPSVAALSAADDARLVAELELCRKHEELARLRALVDRADHLLVQVLACGAEVMPASRRS